MKRYIVYSNEGEILRTGECADGDLSLQGENVIEGLADDSKQYVEDGRVVDMPPKPGNHYRFNFATKGWQPDPESAEAAARVERTARLTASDWTQLPDVPLATKEAWASYRQALRDITGQPGFPMDIAWPTPPA